MTASLRVLILLGITGVVAYLPGLRPVDYCFPGQKTEGCKSQVPVFVNRLDSKSSVITREYHYFDFCLGPEMTESPVENLGQVLYGERIRPSPYKITFGKNVTCVFLCSKTYLSNSTDDMQKYKKLLEGVRNGYTHHWIVDNLPVMFCPYGYEDLVCLSGFPMGIREAASYRTTTDSDDSTLIDYIFNHVDILIEYRDLSHNPNYFDSTVGGRIISVKATPYSVMHPDNGDSCMNTGLMALPKTFDSLEIKYTYSVRFVETDVKWASRWDYILQLNGSANIQWFGISNSVLIVIFLSAMIAIILLRTLRRDIARYNQFDNTDDVQEEFGWKLVHGDVFRSPRYGILLSVLVGSGVQILCMLFTTLVFSFIGFVSPARRGSMITSLVISYILFAVVNGYVSARLYKAIGGVRWKLNVILSSLLCPGIIFSMFFMCNMILYEQRSSAVVPFLTLLLLVFLWLGVSIPLTFIGAYYGYRKPRSAYPVRTNQIPRQIPPQPFFSKAFPSMFMAGALPFGCIYVQMFFIFNSLWAHQAYYMFGFLFAVFIILLVTLAETSIVLCYFQLCGEDYRWWWRAFLSSGFTAAYLFIYSVYFFVAKLELTGVVSVVLYFSYCFIFIFIFFLLCGAVGFLSCLWFVRKIYSVVKVD